MSDDSPAQGIETVREQTRTNQRAIEKLEAARTESDKFFRDWRHQEYSNDITHLTSDVRELTKDFLALRTKFEITNGVRADLTTLKASFDAFVSEYRIEAARVAVESKQSKGVRLWLMRVVTALVIAALVGFFAWLVPFLIHAYSQVH